jgi:hypothetical protein
MKIEIIPLKEEYEYFIEKYPPVLSNKALPNWYKNGNLNSQHSHWLNQNFDNTKGEVITAKSCPAIQDTVIEGITIPLWGNLHFASTEDESGKIIKQQWDFTARHITDSALEPIFMNSHSKNQLENMPLGLTVDDRLLKLALPYKIIVPKGYNIYYTDPFYHFRNDIRCMSGLVQADKWGFVTLPFSILNNNFHIKAGTPLIQCFIYKRNITKLKLVTRKGTKKEYKKNHFEIRDFNISEKNYRYK